MIRNYVVGILIVGLSLGFSGLAKSAEVKNSGILGYKYEPTPQEVKPKLYNWEIKFNETDSQKDKYEIVQITKPLNKISKPVEEEEKVLVESYLLIPNYEGFIDFYLYLGDKEPTQNINGEGNIGEPIAFSGRGSGTATSTYIVLPGTKFEKIIPTEKGNLSTDGKLNIIQFIASDDKGNKYQADVILRRVSKKPKPVSAR